jgi:Fe-S-cluster containining protein
MKEPAEADQELPAGNFSSWLSGLQRALRGEAASDVPCGDCTACCTSSQFIHIDPDETATLAHIPREVLFPAPGLPDGYVLMGYDENGHCPMFSDGGCSIYAHRPRTCRTYDCRIFPAAGLDSEPDDQPLIARRAGRWRFAFDTEQDRTQHAAVRAAASFLRRRDGLAPRNPTQVAVLAIESHRAFLRVDERSGRS